MHYQFITTAILFNLASCISMGQIDKPDKAEIVQLKTNFYNLDGKPRFTDIMKIWYKDSVAIEKINRTNIVTDTANITTISYTVLLYRYVDLRSKTLYDYENFSDTAKIINKAVLPDLAMKDHGWSFYSNKISQIQGIPESISDTIIDNITYKRAKFNFLHDDPGKGFMIGYFRCDGKGTMFSLEKSYSRKLNCTMTKFFDFRYGKKVPYASKEVDFISDTLTKEDLNVFESWEKNEKKYPVFK
jgi:hypothetical protein